MISLGWEIEFKVTSKNKNTRPKELHKSTKWSSTHHGMFKQFFFIIFKGTAQVHIHFTMFCFPISNPGNILEKLNVV